MKPFPAWLRSMFPPDLRRRELHVGGMRLHVMETGPEDGRPVLCVHGNPSWGFLYRKVARALGAGDPSGLRVIMPDLFGLGFSEKPGASAHTLERHGRVMNALVDALDLHSATVVLQDWGGAIGLLAFEGQLERLHGMVVLNTVVGPPKPGFKPTAFHRFAHTPGLADIAFRWFGFPQNNMAFAQGDKSSIRGQVRRGYMFPLRRIRDRAAPLALARMVPDTPAHPSIPALVRSQAVFDAFDGPTEIVWGDRDPVLGSVRTWMERLKPNARVTRTGAGHFLQEEVPAEIADAIRRVAAS